jgi:hypothetical protein
LKPAFNLIAMECPYAKNIQCDFVDSSGADKPMECKDCPRNQDPAIKLMKTYPLEEMLSMLPKTIIRDKKKTFRYGHIFDLNITRDGLDNWVIAYQNDKTLGTLFINIHPELYRCCAIMLVELIENKYVS